MKKVIYVIAVMVLLTSCQRGCQRMQRKFQNSARDYEVVMYSGGDTVFYDKFHGIINSEDSSDGMYYFKGDTLIEISGDYVVKSAK